MSFDMKTWVDQFLAQPKETMSPSLCEAFTVLTLWEGEAPPEDVLSDPMFRLVDLRATALGLTFSSTVVTWLAVIAESPGEAVMYLSVLGFRFGKEHLVTMDDVVATFPLGFLSREALSKMWDAQKTDEGQNGLDLFSSY